MRILATFVLLCLPLFATGCSQAAAQPKSTENKVMFVQPLETQKAVILKDGKGSTKNCGEAIDIIEVNTELMKGWRVVSVTSSAAGFCILLEK